MMRDLASLLLAGTLFGGAGAFAIARTMRGILFGFAPNHYATPLDALRQE